MLHQIGKMVGMKHRFHATIGQQRSLKMQFSQRCHLKKADAYIHGMTVQRLQQLIGT